MMRVLTLTTILAVLFGVPCLVTGYVVGYKHAQVNRTVDTATSILNPSKWFGGE